MHSLKPLNYETNVKRLPRSCRHWEQVDARQLISAPSESKAVSAALYEWKENYLSLTAASQQWHHRANLLQSLINYFATVFVAIKRGVNINLSGVNWRGMGLQYEDVFIAQCCGSNQRHISTSAGATMYETNKKNLESRL